MHSRPYSGMSGRAWIKRSMPGCAASGSLPPQPWSAWAQRRGCGSPRRRTAAAQLLRVGPHALYLQPAHQAGTQRADRHSRSIHSIHACLAALMPHQGRRELAVREGAGHGGAALAAGKVHLQDERPDAPDAQHCAAYGHQAPCTFELTYQGARRARFVHSQGTGCWNRPSFAWSACQACCAWGTTQTQAVVAYVRSVLHTDAAPLQADWRRGCSECYGEGCQVTGLVFKAGRIWRSFCVEEG